MGTNLSFSSAYHPQMDGQTEVVNKILGDLLRSLVTEHHSQWDNILPQAEFAYNDSTTKAQDIVHFKLFMGCSQEEFLELRDSEQIATRSASAEYFAEAMKELHRQVKEQL
jgi:hypothetical protein